MAKEFIDLEGLTTFKNKYDEKIDNDFSSISTEDIQSLFDDLYATLTYTITEDEVGTEVQLAYLNCYFDAFELEGEELLDGTESEDNADTITYTFAEAGTYTVKVRVKDATDLSYLFYNCTSLTSVGGGALFAFATSNKTFANTFYGCSGITSLPEDLFKYNTAVTTFEHTFRSTSITEVPAGLFKYNTAVTSFYGTVSYTKITTLPEGLFDNCPEVTSFNRLVESSTITTFPEGIIAKNTKVTDFGAICASCSKLTSIPEDLFDGKTLVTTFWAAFKNCTSLTSIPSGLFADCPLVTTYGQAFYNNTSLTGETPVNSEGLKLWELAGTDGYPSSITGTGCFYNCTGLDDYDEIDDDWK